MRKIFMIVVTLILTVGLYGQTEVSKRNMEIRKTTPILNLNGVGAALQFYNDDVSLVHAVNELNIEGGRLDVNANLRVGSTSTLTISKIDIKDGKFVLLDSNGDTLSAYVKVADRIQAYNVLPQIFSGAGAPSVSAGKMGDIYINTTNGAIYISSAAGSSDWKQVSN